MGRQIAASAAHTDPKHRRESSPVQRSGRARRLEEAAQLMTCLTLNVTNIRGLLASPVTSPVEVGRPDSRWPTDGADFWWNDAAVI